MTWLFSYTIGKINIAEMDRVDTTSRYLGLSESTPDDLIYIEKRPFVLAVYGVICAVGVAGNLLVCIVLLRVRSLRSNTSDFLVHLALVDLAVCALVIPFKIVLPLIQPFSPKPDFWGQVWCRLFVGEYFFWVCTLVSVLVLVSVHLERFVAIVYPLKYKQIFTRRRYKGLLLALCWATAILTKSPALFSFDEHKIFGCRLLNWPSAALQAAFGVYNFTIQLFAPFLVILAMQWKVIKTLRRQVRALSGRVDLNPADRRRVWQLRATQVLVRTLLAFGVTFSVCWIPDQSMYLLYNFGFDLSIASTVRQFGIILGVCNSCINPIIYTMTNQQFRKGVMVAFSGKRTARVGDATTTMQLAVISARTEGIPGHMTSP